MVQQKVIPIPASIKSRIKACAKDSYRVRFTQHAMEMMEKRGITSIQVFRCLQHGIFDEDPVLDHIHGTFKFRMRVRDSGDDLHVAGALEISEEGDAIVLITAFFGGQ